MYAGWTRAKLCLVSLPAWGVMPILVFGWPGLTRQAWLGESVISRIDGKAALLGLPLARM